MPRVALQQLDAITLKHLGIELEAWLVGARVSKVQQPERPIFVFTPWPLPGIGGRGGSLPGPPRELRLLVCLRPELPVVLLAPAETVEGLVLAPLSKPTALCMLLRKHLLGARIVEVNTLPGEQVLNLVFENTNELGNRVRLVLSLELMGKHTNLILVDDVQGLVLGTSRTVTEHMSRFREVATGLPYSPPPRPPEKPLLCNLTREDFSARLPRELPPVQDWGKLLQQRVWGIHPQQIQAVMRTRSPQTPVDLFEALQNLELGLGVVPALHKEGTGFSLLGGEPDSKPAWQPMPSVHAMTLAYALPALRQVLVLHEQRALTQVLEQLREKRKKHETSDPEQEEAERLACQETGTLLLTALGAGVLAGSHPTAARVELNDLQTNQRRSIPVDPALSWTDNAQAYFKKAKKGRARQAFQQQKAESREQEAAYLDELLLWIQQADHLAALRTVRQELVQAGYLRAEETGSPTRQKEKPKDLLAGILSLRSSDGFSLLVGRSSEANGRLVGKLAKPHDLWLHAQNLPGSHVVIQTDKQTTRETLPSQTLLEAAMLAVHFSRARQSKNVPVVLTEARHVRKIPRSYPGHVTYTHEETLFVTPDPVVLNRLLGEPPSC